MYYIGTLHHMIVVAFVRLLRGLCEPLSVALRSLMVHGCEELLIELIAQCNHTICVCLYVYVYFCMCGGT